jgi:hypothetical protein
MVTVNWRDKGRGFSCDSPAQIRRSRSPESLAPRNRIGHEEAGRPPRLHLHFPQPSDLPNYHRHRYRIVPVICRLREIRCTRYFRRLTTTTTFWPTPSPIAETQVRDCRCGHRWRCSSPRRPDWFRRSAINSRVKRRKSSRRRARSTHLPMA